VGANYLGRRAAFKDSQGQESYVPSYVTFDAMAAYQVTDNIQLQLNGYNLFDKYYYANTYYSSDAENHAIPGAGRTFLFTVAVNY
jgi:catecholate siderophore receptor